MGKIKIQHDNEQYLHIKEASALVGVSDPYLRRACSSKTILCVRAGGAWYVAERELPNYKRLLIQGRATKEVVNRIKCKDTARGVFVSKKLPVGGEIQRKQIF